MPDQARNLIKQTISNTPSTTGALTLSSAVTGWLALGAGDDGLTFSVTIYASDSDTAAKEVRTGCTYTHSGTSLSRGTLESGTAIDLTSSAIVTCAMPASAGNDLSRAMQAVMPGGRLTLESGVPVSTTDQTAKTTIYYTPYVHNTIPLWDGSRWVPVTFAETSEALGTLTSDLEHNVFAFLSSGVLDLEKAAWGTATVTFTNGTDVVNWTSTPAVDGDVFFFYGGTAPTGLANYTTYYVRDKATNSFKLAATPGGAAINFTTDGSGTITGKLHNVTLQDGRWCKNGDKTRLLLGTFYTASTTTTEDSITKRFVSNIYNAVQRKCVVSSATAHSYNGGYRYWNNDSTLRVQIVVSQPSGIAASFGCSGEVAVLINRYGICGQKLDASNSYDGVPAYLAGGTASNVAGGVAGVFAQLIPTGYHYIAATQSSASAGATDFNSINLSGSVLA